MQLLNLLIGKSHMDIDIHVTAPTNPAASVIGHMTDRHSVTIQSLMGLRVHNDRYTGESSLVKTKNYKALPNCLILIDEASFMDDFLLQEVIKGSTGAKVLCILDPYQLAPPKSKVIPVAGLKVRTVSLTTVKRNPGPIAELAGMYREAVQSGKFPVIQTNGTSIVHMGGADFQAAIDHEFSRSGRTPKDARILAWTNNRVVQYNTHVRGVQGRGELVEVGEYMVANQPIQINKQMLVTTDSTVRITEVGGTLTRHDVVGRLIRINNNPHQIFMPDNTTHAIAKCKELAAKKEWHEFYTIKEEWADLRAPHASTVHKAQGATVSTAFLDLSDISRNNDPEEFARLMYVATSRPTTKLVLYGSLPYKYGSVI